MLLNVATVIMAPTKAWLDMAPALPLKFEPSPNQSLPVGIAVLQCANN